MAVICRSFGVLLWEIMTLGRTPYPGVENRELLEQIEEHGLKLNKPKGCPQSMYGLLILINIELMLIDMTAS